jgi:hypothetical protein
LDVALTVLLRRHWPLLVVLAVATALRAGFVWAYSYAFFFNDSRAYAVAALESKPYQVRPWGYSGLIKPFLDQPYIWIAVIQHLVGLAVIVAGYFFLCRRGCRPWLAALAMVPFAVDARVLTLEHYVLAETPYVAATAAGLFLLAWRDKVGWVAAGIGGVFLGFAALTRTVGLPVLALALVYLLVRRAGIVRLAAFALPVVALLGGYMVWYHHSYGVYAFGQYQGRFLYARVMPIADCTKLKLTAEQQKLCMPNPPAEWTQRPDGYIWSTSSPAMKYYPSPDDDPVLNKFATTVIEQRPGAYLAMVAEQTSWHLRFHAPVTGSAECLATQWLPPPNPGDVCQARYYLPAVNAWFPPPNFLIENRWAKVWSRYGEWVTTPGPLYAIGVLVALFAAVWRVRGRPWRDAADALMFTLGGFGLILVSVATSLFDYRYAEPAVLLIPVGLALAVNRIIAVSRKPVVETNEKAELDLGEERAVLR